jgi:sigma-E factor negative regulatory protein RseA
MTEKLREQVSALADNELPESEHELLVRRFAAERHLCLCWERYHLIGEAMRKGLPHADTRGFADRIMLALGQQPVGPSRRARRMSFGRAAAGITVAVCVAVVALASVRYAGGQRHASATSAEIVPPASALQTTPVAYGMLNTAAWNGNAPEVQAELNNYIINHNEISAALGQQDLLPYNYIITYNVNRPARTGVQPGQPKTHPKQR